MIDKQKVIVRFLDKRLVRGYLDDFSAFDDTVSLEDETSQNMEIKISELKGIFFVRTFEGDREHKEKKSFIGRSPAGRRVFVKFKDGESVMGYVEGDVPWGKGFFLESVNQAGKSRGFFLKPVDDECNNIRIFVVATAIADVTVIG